MSAHHCVVDSVGSAGTTVNSAPAIPWTNMQGSMVSFETVSGTTLRRLRTGSGKIESFDYCLKGRRSKIVSKLRT